MAKGGGIAGPVRNTIPGAPKTVPGSPNSVPGAPHYIPGGPTRQLGNFLTTVPDLPSSGEFRDEHTRQLRDFSGRYAGPNGISWTGLDVVSRNMFEFGEKVEKNAKQAMEDLAKDMQAYAQANAPWQDRTGDARRGLKSHVIHGAGRSTIFLGGSVRYQIWLEIRYGGIYAIILPTLQRFQPEVVSRIVAGR